MRRNKNFLHSQFFCYFARMERTCAAECHQAEFADIVAFLYGYASDRTDHVGVNYGDDSVCCTFHIKIRFITDFCLDRILCQLNIYVHSATEDLLLVQFS